MVKLVVFDFDGVFTTGECSFDGEKIIKTYNVKDGKAVGLLKSQGIYTGLISSYNSGLSVVWSQSEIIDNQIATHLKFDKTSIGEGQKIVILEKWLEDYNLDFKDVAYIGDDLPDLEILKRVGFSGCPLDAIQECRDVVDYVCKSKGGEGCVREFVEKILGREESTFERIIHEMKREVNFQLDGFDSEKVKELCGIIEKCKGNIYCTGIGKSKNACKELCGVLKSLNYKCFELDAVECFHGDIGTIRNGDICILFSKSGNTKELVKILDMIKSRGCTTVGFCCDTDSAFHRLCDYIVQLPFREEISGKNPNVPTNSFTCQILFSNLLVSVLKENISPDVYKTNHMGGSIGKRLAPLSEYITLDFPKFVIDQNITLSLLDVILVMTTKKIGCAFFVDNNNVLQGILTDGDIRRMLLEKSNIDIMSINNINKDFYFETNLRMSSSMCKKFSFIPIIQEGKLKGVCDMIS
jgi:arabinose-5-phosphate isomerase